MACTLATEGKVTLPASITAVAAWAAACSARWGRTN